MKNLIWQNPEQLFVAQELINKVKSKCCGIKDNYYNTGKSITTNGNTFLYQINKHNLYWPIPDAAIKSNSGRALWQNFGYDGYNPDVQVWKTWQEAAEDETKAQ